MNENEEHGKQELTLPYYVAAQVTLAVYKIYREEMANPRLVTPSFESWLERIIERGRREQ